MVSTGAVDGVGVYVLRRRLFVVDRASNQRQRRRAEPRRIDRPPAGRPVPPRSAGRTDGLRDRSYPALRLSSICPRETIRVSCSARVRSVLSTLQH